jgi:hypothetical protein
MMYRIAAVFSLFVSTLAADTFTVYTDRASFLNAIQTLPAQPYNTIEHESFDGPSIPGVSIQDYTEWSMLGPDGKVIPPPSPLGYPVSTTTISNGVLNGCEGHFCNELLNITTVWTFSAPIRAFGADFKYADLVDENGLVGFPYQNGFAGFISDEPFTQLTFNAADRTTRPPDCPTGVCHITQAYTMENAVFESTAPEPGTNGLMMAGIGIGLAAFGRRKFRRT